MSGHPAEAAGRVTPYGTFVRLWLIAVRRRWEVELAPLIVLVALSTAHGRSILASSHSTQPLGLSSAALLALVAALFAPNAFQGTSVLATLRFELLPYTPRWFFAIRLAFMQPLRVLLLFSTVGWSVLGIVTGAPSLERALAEVLQLILLAGSLLLLTQLLEDALLRRNAIVIHGALALPGIVASLLLLTFEDVASVLGELFSDHPAARSSALLGSSSGLGSELVWLVSTAFFAGAALLVARRLTVRAGRPSPPRASAIRCPTGLYRVGRLIFPGAPAAFGKELASVLRHMRLACVLLWPFALAIPAFNRGMPLLLISGYVLWSFQTANILGPDLPVGGLRRYSLMPVPLKRTLLLRHIAIAALVTASVLLAGLLVALSGSLRSPAPNPLSFALYAAAILYGITFFLMSTLVGDRLSVRYPNWYQVRLRGRSGETIPLGPSLVGMTALAALTAVPLFTGVITSGSIPAPLGVGRLGPTLIAAAAVQLSLYLLGLRYHESRHVQ